MCSKIVIDLVNADKTEFTLGVTFTAMTEKQINSSKTIQQSVSNVQVATSNAQGSADQANQAVEKVENVIAQMPTDYVKTSVFEVFKTEIKDSIPTKTSRLENDSGYINSEVFQALVERVHKLEEGSNI